MRTKLRVERPEDIEMTLTLTMKLCEWQRLREGLNGSHPAWVLTQAISEMTSAATKVYCGPSAEAFDAKREDNE